MFFQVSKDFIDILRDHGPLSGNVEDKIPSNKFWLEQLKHTTVQIPISSELSLEQNQDQTHYMNK